jgi:EmrB/QacA subfamily drug resistance transporter
MEANIEVTGKAGAVSVHAMAEREDPAPSTRGALAGLSLAMLLASLGTSAVNVALPAIAQAFAASFQNVQWVVLAYLLSITSLIVSAGRLSDTIGRRGLLLSGVMLFTVASIACSIAPTLWFLIAARAIQGVGAAIMMALSVAMVSEAVPKARLGIAMGQIGTMSAIGTALGPSLGGVLTSILGWRAIFLINVPVGIATFLLARRCLPVVPQGARVRTARFDALGTLLLAVTLALYALAMTMGRGSFGVLNFALLLSAILGVGLFIFAERRVASPLVDMAMFQDQALCASLALSACVSCVIMSTLVVGPFYLAHALGLDAAVVGLVSSSGPVVVALSGVPAGRMADRFGAQRMAVVGLTAMAAGSLLLATMPMSLGVPGYIAPIVVITAGYAIFQTANNTAVMMNSPAEQRGVVSGMLNLSRNLGLITGASAMGAIFAFASGMASGATVAPASVAIGMRTTFVAATIMTVFAIAVGLGSQTLAARHAIAASIERPRW